MGRLVHQTILRAERGEAQVEALLDTGASVSVIRQDVAETVTSQFLQLPPRTLRMVNGEEWQKVSSSVNLQVVIKGKCLDGTFYVVPETPRTAIIGVDFMQRWEIKLDPKNHDFSIGVDPDSLEMAACAD